MLCLHFQGLLTILAIVASVVSIADIVSAKPPHVIFIVADDLGRTSSHDKAAHSHFSNSLSCCDRFYTLATIKTTCT